MNHPQLKIIVLRKIKFKESDLIIHGLTASGVKMAFLAKGALKSKKRFGGGVLDPFHFIEITLGNFKGNDKSSLHSQDKIHLITEAKFIRSFEGIKKDYDRLQLGYFFLDAINKVSQHGDIQDSSLYDLLGHALMTLENATDLSFLKIQFSLKILMQQGVLEVEPWMKPLLSCSFQQVQNWGIEDKIFLSQIRFDKIFDTLSNYLISAQV